MAVNFNNPQEVQAFRQQVISQGADPAQTDAYIASKVAVTAPQAPVETPKEPKSALGFVQNVISSGVNTVGDIASGAINILNPNMEKNTVANVGRLALGAAEKLVPGEQSHEKYANAVGEFYKNRYGSLEAVGDTFYEDPVGALLDASLVLDAGASAAGIVGKVSKSSKLLEASKLAKSASKAVDPLRLATKGAKKIINPQTEKIGKLAEEAGTATRQGVSKIYAPASVYGAEREAKISKTLDDLKITGSAQAKYEKLQPAMKNLATQIDTQLALKPVPISEDLVKSAFKEKIASTIRTSDLELPQAQAMVQKYLSDLSEIPVTQMTSQDLFGLKKIVNGDTTKIYDKLEKNMPITPKEEVILAFRNTLDDIIGKTNPEVKQLTLQQSNLYDAADSLNRARKTVPTTRIMGTTVPANISQNAQDLVGRTLQNTGQNIRSGVPQVGLTTLSKSLPVIGNAENSSQAIENEPQNIGQDPEDQDTSYGEANNQLNSSINQGDPSSNILTSDIIPQEHLNPYGANSGQIWEAYLRTRQEGNKRKAAVLKEMFDEEVKYETKRQNPKINSSGAAALSDSALALGVADELEDTIAESREIMGPISGKARSYNPYDTRAQVFNSKMTTAAQIIGKALEGGVLRAEDTKKYLLILPKISDTPQLAREKIKAVKKLLENRMTQQEKFYRGATPDVTTAPPVEDAQGGGTPGLNIGKNVSNFSTSKPGLEIPPKYMYR